MLRCPSFSFVTMIFSAFATIHRRSLMCLVVVLSISGFGVGLITEYAPSYSSWWLDTALKLAGLVILVFMTLKRTLRPVSHGHSRTS